MAKKQTEFTFDEAKGIATSGLSTLAEIHGRANEEFGNNEYPLNGQLKFGYWRCG